MVLLTPLVLGIVQLGFVLHVRNTLTSAASDGARAGRAQELVRTALADRFAEHVSAHEMTVGGIPAMEVEIAAEVPALGILGPAVPLHVDGHAVKEVIP
jgi:hypothetical protein